MGGSLVDVGSLSAPVTKLVEVVAKGCGVLYSPIQTVRQAKADAASKIIHAHADMAVADISSRAIARVNYIEEVRQDNLDRITGLAERELPDSVSADPVDRDWIGSFFDCAKDICDNDMQIIWGRILAAEVTKPGEISKRTLRFLQSFDKSEAEAFTKICSLSFSNYHRWNYLIMGTATYEELRSSFGGADWVSHFSSIGLFLAEETSYLRSRFMKSEIEYFGRRYEVVDAKGASKGPWVIEPMVGVRYFSSIGQDLVKVAGAQPLSGFVDRVSQGLANEISCSLIH